MLHGYTGSSGKIERYFALQKEADKRGILTVYPDGNKDPKDNQFWNATDACCDFLPATRTIQHIYVRLSMMSAMRSPLTPRCRSKQPSFAEAK